MQKGRKKQLEPHRHDDENEDDVAGIRSTRFARFAFTHTLNALHGIYAYSVFTLPSSCWRSSFALHASYFVYMFSQCLAVVVVVVMATTTAAAFQPLLSIRLTLAFPHRNNIHSALYALLLSVHESVWVWGWQPIRAQTKETLFTVYSSVFIFSA